ncbi:MAG: MFS transporter [Anaerolineae bacterium]|nr:MAG: MFS transporter [Anaerolineae bacterium]
MLAALRGIAAPPDLPLIQRRNFLRVQIDAIGVGLASAAAPFLPIFLTRLGATSQEVSYLTSMPALTGLLLGIAIGQLLQKQRNIVRWFSAARFLVLLAYAVTALLIEVVPSAWLIRAILLLWALVTLPQTVVAVSFNVVMNGVAGPQHRYDLMSRRWSILGITMAITTAVAGQLLEHLPFPLNYQIVFSLLSLGSLISFAFSSKIELPPQPISNASRTNSVFTRLSHLLGQIWREKPFVRFVSIRFIFLIGTTLAAPLFPLYYVREVKASDAWIGIFNTAQTAVLLVGYFAWTMISRARGSRFTLLVTTFGVSLYPILVAHTHQVQVIALIAGVAGFFQAGIDLVFFDELMKTIPDGQSAIFVAVAQTLTHLSSFIAPIASAWLSDLYSLPIALTLSGIIRFLGFGLFLTLGRKDS